MSGLNRRHSLRASVKSKRRSALAAAVAAALVLGPAGAMRVHAGDFTSVTYTAGQMNDTNVGIQNGENYVDAVNVIGSDVSINSLNFNGSGSSLSGTDGTSGVGWSITNVLNPFSGGGNKGGTDPSSNIGNLFDGFQYGGNPGTFTLSNLTVGQTYVLTFYNQTWSANDGRFQTITASGGSSGDSGGSASLNEDPGATGDGNLIRYTFQATGTSQALSFLPQNPGNTFHFYGFSTQQVFNNFWNPTDGNLNYSDSNNWTTTSSLGGGQIGAPNGPGLSAAFSPQSTATTITLDQSVTIGHLQFAGANPITLFADPTSGNTLTLQADPGGASALTVLSGTHALAVPVILANDLVKLGSGTINVTGNVSGTGGFNISGGTVIESGRNTYNGPTTIAGTLRLAAPVVVGNPSFESPALGPGNFQYNPPNATWTFTGSSAIQSNGSAWGAPATPDGVQTAVIQSKDSNSSNAQGVISQSLNFPQNGSYVLTFYSAGRGSTGADPFSVSLDSNVVTATPITPSVNVFNLFAVSLDNVTAGSHVITFQDVSDGSKDIASFLDLVQINVEGIPSTSAVSLTTPTALLDLNGNSELIGSLTGVAGSSVTLGGGNLITGNDNTSTLFSGVISGAGVLVKWGSGTQALSGFNTYTGETLINAGGIDIGDPAGSANGSSNTLSTGPVVVSNNASLRLVNSGLAIANLITLNGTAPGGALVGGLASGTVADSITSPLTLAATSNVSAGGSGATFTLAGQVTGPGGFIADSYLNNPGGKVVLANPANNYAGDTSVASGTGTTPATLQAGAVNVIPSGASAGNVTVNNLLDLNTFSQSINGLNGFGIVDTVAGGSPVLTLGNNNASGNFTGVIRNTAGSLSLSKVGSGTQTLNGISTYSGSTAIAGGTIKLAPANAILSGAVAYWPFEGNVNDQSGNGNNGTANNGPTYTMGRFGQAISLNNNQDVTVPNSASLQLSGNFTVSAWFDLNALSSGAYGILGTRFGQETTFDLKVNASPAAGQQSIHGDIGNGSNWINTALDVNGQTFNTHQWYMVTYVLTPTGANLYVNGVDVQDYTWASDSPTLMTSAAGATLHAGDSFASEFMNGAIDDVAIYGSALTTQQVSSLYLGTIPAGQLPVTTPLQIASGATFDLNGVGQTVQSLSDLGTSGGGIVTNGGANPVTLTVTPPLSTTFTGVIQDGASALAFTMSGTGTQALAGANTYSGGSNVMNGTLLAYNASGSATGSGPVAVGDSTGANNFRGKLAGTGSIGGPVTVNRGSTISAGDGSTTTGTLSLTSAAGNTLADGSNYLWKINDASGTAGGPIGWDKLVFSSLSVSANSSSGPGSVDVIPDQTSAGTLTHFNSGSAYKWTIANVPGNGNTLLANFHLDSAALSTFAQENNASPSQFSLGADPNVLYVSYTPAPEPGGLCLLGVASLALLRRRRRPTAG